MSRPATLADLLPAVDVGQATAHLAYLHADAPGYLSLVLLGAQRRERHGFTAINELRVVTGAAAIAESTTALQDTVDAYWNVYTACASFTAPPERGRGTRRDVLSVPGVWADLDVKPGVDDYFQSEAALLAYRDRLLTPTLEVATGSGGRHLYWLLHHGQRLDAALGQALLSAWLDHLRAEAEGSVIENVHDSTRILRLAGTTRWPKQGDDLVGEPRQVRLVATGPRYHAGELRTLAQAANERAQAARDELRQYRGAAEQRRLEVLEQRGVPTDVFVDARQRFNLDQDWAALLEPTGWTLCADARDGAARCRFWTRPGKSVADGKSASTDYVYDDGSVSSKMTIYSQDPALSDLWENAGGSDGHGLCSKWHYARQRLFHGDELALYAARAKTGTLA